MSLKPLQPHLLGVITGQSGTETLFLFMLTRPINLASIPQHSELQNGNSLEKEYNFKYNSNITLSFLSDKS